MFVTCADILNLDSFHNCRLLTEQADLNRVVSWPYLAKVLLQTNFFEGGEFVLIAETYVKYDEQILLSFLDICQSQHIAALGIFIDNASTSLSKVPESVIQKGNQYNIPIFELDWNLRSIDVLKDISVLIIESLHHEDAIQTCLKNIIFYDIEVNSNNFAQLINLGYRDNPYRLIRIQLVDFDHYCESLNIDTELKKQEKKLFLWHLIEHSLNNLFPQCLVFYNSNIMIAIIQENFAPGTDVLSNRIQTFYSTLSRLCPSDNIRVCCSKEYKSIYDVNQAFHDTTHLIELTNTKEFQDKPVIYDKIGIYKMLLTSRKKALKQIYESIMTPLIEYDAQFESQLVETLSAYIYSNCNLDEVSKKLYIHINTTRYRLKKIESITNMSLKSTDDLTILCYCIHIKSFLQL